MQIEGNQNGNKLLITVTFESNEEQAVFKKNFDQFIQGIAKDMDANVLDGANPEVKKMLESLGGLTMENMEKLARQHMIEHFKNDPKDFFKVKFTE